MTDSFDPVEAFLSGITSGVVRFTVGFLMILLGFAVSFLPSDWQVVFHTGLDFWGLATVGLLFWWGMYGAWFFGGLIAFIFMLVFVCAFAQDWNAKLSLFGVFACAVIYYLPITVGAGRWVWTVGISVGLGVLYWGGPWLFRRRQPSLEEDE